MNLALDVFEDVGVTHIVLAGDTLDMYNVNAHGPKHPAIHTTLEDEINAGREFVEYLVNRFPGVHIIWMAGNHFFRLERFIVDKVPSFYNLFRLEKMLRLEELGVEFIPYNERIQLGQAELFVQHSPPSYSNNAAAASMVKKIDQSHIYGCSHRPDWSLKIGSSGRQYYTHMLGWFGDKGIFHRLQKEMPENKKVFAFTKNHESWGRSFALASVHGKYHATQHVLIDNYTCSIGPDIYKG